MLLPTTIQVPSAKSAITTAASLAASAVLLRSIAGDLVPHEIQHLFLSKLRALLASFSPEVTLVIEEFHGFGLNHLFAAAETYLGTKLSPSTSTQRFRASLAPNDHNVSVSLDRNDAIVDNFKGIPLKWRLVSKQIPTKFVSNPSDYSCNAYSEIRYFELNFHKKHRDTILNAYLRHITEESKAAKEEKKTLKLFTLKYDRMRPRRGSPWQSVNLDHPATFETVAMEAEMKRKVVEDLERFVRRKDYYRKVGKAWKRGYMLFGPPGTGKSSLVAAMANYLNFDVYDLELTDLRCNSDLRRLLISTANRSILVVEDIDCSIEFHNRREKEKDLNPFRRSNRGSQVTLSGLLNFIDGLWSSCGDERIIVFTTNHKEKLDPALLRPGRMDVHVHMSYCTPSDFKMLASNYLGITDHPSFSHLLHLMQTKKVSPAEVGEQLMKSDDPEVALRGLVYFLEEKKESEESKGGDEKPGTAREEEEKGVAEKEGGVNGEREGEAREGE
ncbi:AAA-ATPase At3g50940-like isoform X1 [Malania oleifera]|uniref:AAA-ATPase At3g50940-like isoform X1 n=1 Tax=Malania oleifera TaxID=397392 RepID=UPI0025ADD2A5|nr:AAA-ATPase At3g50940-like isoform X1 [Malania oleifera]